MNFDTLGDRMKFYEGNYRAHDRLMPGIPALVRLDGKAFHTFTKGLTKPIDKQFHECMVATTLELCRTTNAVCGYTQSDEISLVLCPTATRTGRQRWGEIWFDGRRDKINSVLAGICALVFSTQQSHFLPCKDNYRAVFDCRCWSVPNREEAVNYLIWRELDATRNSIQAYGQHRFSHTQLMGKSCNQIQEMLFQQHGVNWNHEPAWAKRGTIVQRRIVEKPFTAAEREKLPAKHAARQNPGLTVRRKEYVELPMPRLLQISNSLDLVFSGAEHEQADS